MTNRLNSVAWMEGMFLRPQHFQHGDRYWDEKLHYHLRAVDPFHWGVRELEVDEEALTDHRISITRLDAVLPGGTLVRHPGNAVVESREFDPSAERTDVYIGVRHLSPSEPNSAMEDDAHSDRRFVLRNHLAPDLQRGGFETELTLAHPKVRVFLSGDEELVELYESIRLGEIMATGDLARPFVLNPLSAPPLLAVEAWPPLHDEVSKIVNQMAGLIRVMVGRTTTLSTADLPRYWMRYTLARLTPVLRHQLATGFTRPFDLYLALLEAGSALSAFQSTEAVELPNYDHNDLMGCFQHVIDHIRTHLGEGVPTRFTELQLAFQTSDRIYSTTELTTSLVDPRNAVYLAVNARMDGQELSKWVEEHAKAGSAKGVKTLTLLNVEGLRMQHLPGAPTEIQSRAGFEYFVVETNGAQWNKVREEFSFGLNLGRLEDADARLYVVAPEG